MEVTPGWTEVGRLTRVLLKHARDAFVDEDAIAAQWRALRFTAPPDFGRAVAEYDRFAEIIQATGARVDMLPRDPRTTLDSIYVRDASLVSPGGALLCAMGKPARIGEPHAQADALRRLGVPVGGEVLAPGRIEGGDVIWLDRHTVAVGHGYRTSADGIRQLRALLGGAVRSSSCRCRTGGANWTSCT
jgi:N-dimethylarginine dimethylaminohydrolase